MKVFTMSSVAIALTLAFAGGDVVARDMKKLPDPWGGPKYEPTYESFRKSAAFPYFVVDPRWPKPLPNNWIIGQVGGLAVDRDDNIWILQRARSLDDSEAGATDAYVDPETGEVATNDEGVPIDGNGNERPYGPIAECCHPAPAVMKFDPKGNLLDAWGGPADEGYLGSDQCREEDGCVWPAGEHGIYVDHNGYVYIAGNGNGTGGTPWAGTHGWDGHILKFKPDGTHVLTIGKAGGADVPTSNDTDSGLNGTPQLWRPADMEVDAKTNELYVADGYGNHRVLVVDAETGQYKRHWGAYGMVPVDDAAADAVGPYAEDRDAGITPQYFRNPVHCVRITHDRRVYVCDRVNDRIQVFKTSGEFITEKFLRAETLLNGSVWDLDTSTDRQQSCLYNVDGSNQKADTLHRRSLQLLASFGRSGRYAAQFHWVHNVAVASDGNLYTAEVDTGKRAQKFVRHGPDGCSLRGGAGQKVWDSEKDRR